MHAEIMHYNKEIFQSSACAADLSHRVPSRISHEMNSRLLRSVEPEEVKSALFSMAPDKAPRPDGITPAFYQSFWSIVGGDLTRFVTDRITNCRLPPGLNDAHVVLIPKKKVPEYVSDLRPIALCNVAYKVIVKVLANRLEEVLDEIISSSQSAFVPDRLITDNITVAGEIGHFLRRKRGGKDRWAALKLDMAKAYDRMEWGFLKGMLIAMGIRWARLYHRGVYSKAIPYRHIYLSFVLNTSTNREAREVKTCLDWYSGASGQLVNFDKSNIMFSGNIGEHVSTHVARVFGVRRTEDFGKYLGLPLFLGRNKTALLWYIEQRVRDRANMWQKKLLSRAGKEVLLKSVAQAMPIFAMSVFLLPNGVCDSIEKIMNRYWWANGGPGRKGLHWMSWSHLAIPKTCGGLGFKRLQDFNVALLSKQGWRILVNPQSMFARILKARYFPDTDFLDATLGHNPSYTWRSILAGQSVLREGVMRRIGDGADTFVWGNPWLAHESEPSLRTACVVELRDAKVCQLLTHEGTWDEDVVQDIFVAQDIDRILRTPVSPAYKDSWCWRGNTRGLYTVQQGYHIRNILPVRELLKTKGRARSDCTWNNVRWSVAKLVDEVNMLVATWKEHFVNKKRAVRGQRPTAGWEPPPPDFHKCNVDAAMLDHGVGYGAVL
ncbi:PREDICTED: uncharacterized protein LOC109147522 [Ipomoea nil]|uniref:uncharacterized protein LOC109147522 n=1 Tax=Ipomoea nil TaxID=35883 RepID=UPI0009019A74|nr:PREDICTED: uncharacterized protein LOC109147522 [Ipomoea nil]